MHGLWSIKIDSCSQMQYIISMTSPLLTHLRRVKISKSMCLATGLYQALPLTRMIPYELWPVLLLITISFCIGILACLAFTVFSIIFERQAADEEALYRRGVEYDSPPEGYCTFKRSFNGSFNDYTSRNGQRRASITPNKSPKQKEGNKLHASTVKRGAQLNHPGT